MKPFSMGRAREPEPLPPECDVFRPPVDDRTPEQKEIDRAITTIASRWNALPAMTAKQGRFEVAAGDPRARFGQVVVPDGRYRIEGHEWMLTFKGGALVRGDRIASIETDPGNYRAVTFTA
jgi:hypothetical protein